MNFTTRLAIPPRLAALPLLHAFARELALLAGLDSQRRNAVELACEETLAAIAERAAEDSPEPVEVDGQLTPLALLLTFTDRELPPPPDDQALPGGAEAARDDLLAGLGRKLIRASSDEAAWELSGREGNRVRLLFKRPTVDIVALAPSRSLQPFSEAEAAAPAQAYRIRRAGEPNDWYQIARAIYRVYGYTYPFEDIYYPDRLAELNRSGRLVSLVAEAADGEVVGHYALELGGQGQVATGTCTIAETGMAVIHPAHRRQGLMEKMRARLEDEARALGLIGLFSQPVTRHGYSQLVNEKYGAFPCAASLAILGGPVQFRAPQDQELTQRESCLLYYKPLSAPAPRTVELPPRHRQMLLDTYAGCTIPVSEGALPAEEGPSVVSSHFFAALGCGVIRVEKVGADIAAALRGARNHLCRVAGARVLYLTVRLTRPGSAAACAAAEPLGFFYGGLAPHFDDGEDVLRLQYLDVPFDIALLQMVSPSAARLLDYIAADRQRVENP